MGLLGVAGGRAGRGVDEVEWMASSYEGGSKSGASEVLPMCQREDTVHMCT